MNHQGLDYFTGKGRALGPAEQPVRERVLARVAHAGVGVEYLRAQQCGISATNKRARGELEISITHEHVEGLVERGIRVPETVVGHNSLQLT
jgi:hypothetical protein